MPRRRAILDTVPPDGVDATPPAPEDDPPPEVGDIAAGLAAVLVAVLEHADPTAVQSMMRVAAVRRGCFVVLMALTPGIGPTIGSGNHSGGLAVSLASTVVGNSR